MGPPLKLIGSRRLRRQARLRTHHQEPIVHAGPLVRTLAYSGASPAPSRHAWLTAVESDPRILAMRADRRRNVLAAARILGWTSRDGTTRPTRSRTAARMGVTERTVSKLWRELERLGYLACVEQGTTAQYRPSWAREEGNLARCWRLVL